MKLRKNFLQKMIVIVLMLLMLLEYIIPNITLAYDDSDELKDVVVWSDSLHIWNPQEWNINDDNADTKNWDYSRYEIKQPMIDFAIDKYAKDANGNIIDYKAKTIKDYATTFNSTLEKLQGETTLIDALGKASDEVGKQESNARDEAPGNDANRDGYTGSTVGVEDNDYGLGGVLFDPILDFIVSIGDVVVNALQGTLLEPEKLKESGLFNIANYLIRSNLAGSDNANENNNSNNAETNNNSNGTNNNSNGTNNNSNGANNNSDETTNLSEASTYENATKTINVDTSKFDYGWLNLKKRFYYVKAKYSPEEIFTNTSKNPLIPAFNINFFSNEENTSSGSSESSGNSESEEALSTLNLRPMIASWYIAFRNLSIAGLLCVLVYIGIRILMSSAAADKAKYKQLLKDWLIALILLFTMHYIMAFTVTIVETIVTGINSNSTSSVKIEGEGIDIDYTTNLIGAARFQTQYKDIGRRMPYVIMYIALIVYTVIFTVFYFKRALMMAFLTMIAPLVAFTYPIDKITDGKAQAFNAWIKEYVYNALIQPFHLIIYTIFVSNALDFAKSNVFYMIASLWFVLKAEQILRGFFGFNKASGGTMEALHAVGLASMLGNIARGGSRIKAAASGSSNEVEGDNNIRFNKGADLAKLASGSNQDENTGSGSRPQIPQGPAERANAGGSQKDESTTNYRNIGAEALLGETAAGGASSSASSSNADTNNSGKDKQSGFQRLWRSKTARLPQKARRAIKGIAKTGVKSAYTAGVGALAGAVALASGGDLGAALAATSAGMGIGDRVGNGIINTAGKNYERLRNDADIYFDDDDAATKRRVDKMMYGDDNLYNYVRSSMIAQNDGIIPSNSEVEDRLEQFRPFFNRGIDVKEAERAMNVADDISASDPRYNINYEEAALMVAAGKQDGITKSALQKDGDKLMRDTKATLMNESHLNEKQAKEVADKYYSFQERIHGVEDHQVREKREKEKASGGNTHKQHIAELRRKSVKIKSDREKGNRVGADGINKSIENETVDSGIIQPRGSNTHNLNGGKKA